MQYYTLLSERYTIKIYSILPYIVISGSYILLLHVVVSAWRCPRGSAHSYPSLCLIAACLSSAETASASICSSEGAALRMSRALYSGSLAKGDPSR